MRLGNDFIISEECEWDDDDVGDGKVRSTKERRRTERTQSGRARLRSLSTVVLRD